MPDQSACRDTNGLSPRRSRLLAILRGETAQSMVETALTMPVLMLVVTGIVMVGLTYNNYTTLVEATTTGTHTLAISRGQTTDPCNTAATAIWAAAPGLAKNSFTFTFILNGAQYTGTTCAGSPVSITTGGAANMAVNGTAQVTATYPCNYAAYKFNLGTSCLLTARTKEVIQ